MPDQAPLRLYLVRHGEVAANRQFAFIGHRDDPQTSVGVQQAGALGRVLGRLPIDVVVTSPLRRTVDTAERIASGSDRSPVVEKRLIEQSFGRWLAGDESERPRNPSRRRTRWSTISRSFVSSVSG